MKHADFPSSTESVDKIIARSNRGEKISGKGKDALRNYLSGCGSSNFHTPEVMERLVTIKKILGVATGAVDRVFAADNMVKKLIEFLHAYTDYKDADRTAKMALGILEEAIRNGATREELTEALSRVHDYANDLHGGVVVPDSRLTYLHSAVTPYLRRRVHELPWNKDGQLNEEVVQD